MATVLRQGMQRFSKLSDNTKLVICLTVCLGVPAIPYITSNEKRKAGHGMLDHEMPQDIAVSKEAARAKVLDVDHRIK